MSTTKKPLKYLWTAYFTDGHVIKQPEDDRYSKHDDNAEWNPSSFRDILDYDGELARFTLSDARTGSLTGLSLSDGTFYQNGPEIDSEACMEPKKLIYYRNVEQKYYDGVAQPAEVVEYCLGYEYKDKNGKNIQRILTLDGK